VDVYNRLVDQVAAEHAGSVSVIDLHAMVCPGGRYHQVIDGVTIRNPADGVHFTLSGGDFLASRIWPTVARLGRQELAGLTRAPSPRG
jgi:lysophospholipase L1-like esterase